MLWYSDCSCTLICLCMRNCEHCTCAHLSVFSTGSPFTVYKETIINLYKCTYTLLNWDNAFLLFYPNEQCSDVCNHAACKLLGYHFSCSYFLVCIYLCWYFHVFEANCLLQHICVSLRPVDQTEVFHSCMSALLSVCSDMVCSEDEQKNLKLF